MGFEQNFTLHSDKALGTEEPDGFVGIMSEHLVGDFE